MKTILSFLLFYSTGINAQTINDTLYLKFDNHMKIEENIDVLGYNRIKLSFAITSKNKDTNSRITTYNFEINNQTNDFEDKKFNKIKDVVLKPETEKMNLKSLEDLAKLSDCDLFFLLADTKNLFLVRKNNDDFIKYRLMYLSTQRGWETVKTD